MDKRKLPKEVRDNVDKYTFEGKEIQKEISEIFAKRKVSPVVAHSILKDMIYIIELHDPATRVATDLTDMIMKKMKEEGFK